MLLFYARFPIHNRRVIESGYMGFNQNVHGRRSIRLKGYDYSSAGGYFITIVTQGRECLFGAIRNGEMELNDAGKMVAKWWDELSHKFPSVTADASIVMPNHFHSIIIIHDDTVGADLRVCPYRIRHCAPLVGASGR